MKTTKPLALFATPRSGSTPVSQIIGKYLAEKHQVQYLAEFFNPLYTDFTLQNGILVESRFSSNDRVKQIALFPDALTFYQEQRLKMIQSYDKPVFFKFFPSHVNRKIIRWIDENFHVVCLKRDDMLEHFLSFQISSVTNKWYSENGFNFKPQSLPANEESAKRFFNHLFKYHLLKKKMSWTQEMTYEDFVSSGPSYVLSFLDLKDAPPITPEDYSKKQNNSEKLKIFRNADQLMKWYKEGLCKYEERLKDL